MPKMHLRKRIFTYHGYEAFRKAKKIDEKVKKWRL